MGVPIGAQAPCKDYCQSAHILFYIAQVKDCPRLALFFICSLKIHMDGIFLQGVDVSITGKYNKMYCSRIEEIKAFYKCCKELFAKSNGIRFIAAG